MSDWISKHFLNRDDDDWIRHHQIPHYHVDWDDPAKARIVLDFVQLAVETPHRLEREDVRNLSIQLEVNWRKKPAEEVSS